MNALVCLCGLLYLHVNIFTVLSVHRTFIAKSTPLGFLRAHHQHQHQHHQGNLLSSAAAAGGTWRRAGTIQGGGLQAASAHSATAAGRQCCPTAVTTTTTAAAESLRCKAILLCGGVSQRMNCQLKSLLGSKTPEFSLSEDCPPHKQFISMHGVPLFVYSLAEFVNSPLVAEVTIATKPEWNSKVLQLVDSTASILLRRLRRDGTTAVDDDDGEDDIDVTGVATITTSTTTTTTNVSVCDNLYDDHLRRFPFFLYDLRELRCVLSNSPSWDEALERAVKLRDNSRYKVINLCVSGDHRAETVYNALRRKNALDARLPGCCREEYIALVHDAVRPLARHVELAPLIAEAKRHGAAVPAVGVVDTIKVGTLNPCPSPSSSYESGSGSGIGSGIGSGGHSISSEGESEGESNSGSGMTTTTTFVSSTPDRSTLFAIQTPQAFRSSLLMRAYASVMGEEGKDLPGWLTDDASFVEHLGSSRVAIVQGHRLNMKVTTWEDVRVCSQHLRDTYFPMRRQQK